MNCIIKGIFLKMTCCFISTYLLSGQLLYVWAQMSGIFSHCNDQDVAINFIKIKLHINY